MHPQAVVSSTQIEISVFDLLSNFKRAKAAERDVGLAELEQQISSQLEWSFQAAIRRPRGERPANLPSHRDKTKKTEQAVPSNHVSLCSSPKGDNVEIPLVAPGEAAPLFEIQIFAAKVPTILPMESMLTEASFPSMDSKDLLAPVGVSSRNWSPAPPSPFGSDGRQTPGSGDQTPVSGERSPTSAEVGPFPGSLFSGQRSPMPASPALLNCSTTSLSRSPFRGRSRREFPQALRPNPFPPSGERLTLSSARSGSMEPGIASTRRIKMKPPTTMPKSPRSSSVVKKLVLPPLALNNAAEIQGAYGAGLKKVGKHNLVKGRSAREGI